MNTQYSNENLGVLFTNDKEGNDKRPDFNGKLNVNGKDLEIAAWERTSKKGTKFLSLKVSEPQQKGLEFARQKAQEIKAKQDTVVEPTDAELEDGIDLNDIPF